MSILLIYTTPNFAIKKMDGISPLEAAIEVARNWGRETVAIMRTKTSDDTGALDRSLKAVIQKNRFKELNAIRFKLNYYGIYRELGAGRSYRGAKGGHWKYNAKEDVKRSNLYYKGQRLTNLRQTDPTATHKMGTGKRPENPFFDDTLEQQVPKLADALAEICADTVIKAIGIQNRY